MNMAHLSLSRAVFDQRERRLRLVLIKPTQIDLVIARGAHVQHYTTQTCRMNRITTLEGRTGHRTLPESKDSSTATKWRKNKTRTHQTHSP